MNNVCKKANSVLSFVRRNFTNGSRKIKKDLYFDICQIYSGICSCCLACDRAVNKLESVQRCAACFVMNDYSSVTNMLSRLHINTVEFHFKH